MVQQKKAENKKEVRFVITEDTLRSIVNYLQEKPFKEVAIGIQSLMSLPTLDAVLKSEKSKE